MRIVIGFLLLCAAARTFGQTLPVKEGLWENTVLNDDGSTAIRSLDCVTQKSFVEMMAKANTHPGCTVSSKNITSHGMTVDISCNRPNIQMSVHSVLELLDSEHSRGTTAMKMTINGKSNESTTKSTGRFVRSDCGNIKPGGSQITSQ
ncbi:MAG TPA: DUF3617 family protein [Terracidiphilus sp.]